MIYLLKEFLICDIVCNSLNPDSRYFDTVINCFFNLDKQGGLKIDSNYLILHSAEFGSDKVAQLNAKLNVNSILTLFSQPLANCFHFIKLNQLKADT